MASVDIPNQRVRLVGNTLSLITCTMSIARLVIHRRPAASFGMAAVAVEGLQAVGGWASAGVSVSPWGHFRGLGTNLSYPDGGSVVEAVV